LLIRLSLLLLRLPVLLLLLLLAVLVLLLLHHQQVHVNTEEVGTLSEGKPTVNLVLEPCQISFLSAMVVTDKYVCAAVITISELENI
jgi:hypothetical protein